MKDVIILDENKEEIAEIKKEFIDYQKLIDKIDTSKNICPYLVSVISVYIRDKLLKRLLSIAKKFDEFLMLPTTFENSPKKEILTK